MNQNLNKRVRVDIDGIPFFGTLVEETDTTFKIKSESVYQKKFHKYHVVEETTGRSGKSMQDYL